MALSAFGRGLRCIARFARKVSLGLCKHARARQLGIGGAKKMLEEHLSRGDPERGQWQTMSTITNRSGGDGRRRNSSEGKESGEYGVVHVLMLREDFKSSGVAGLRE